MDEQQVRALVREAIARHLGPAVPAGPAAAASPPSFAAGPMAPPRSAEGSVATARFVVARAPGDVECVIEPSVTCNHCGHCLCYGH